jgi:hypothetical protein
LGNARTDPGSDRCGPRARQPRPDPYSSAGLSSPPPSW